MQTNNVNAAANTAPATFPKPLFSYIGRMYHAVVAAGIPVGSLNRDRADTVVRDLSKTNWKKDNLDIHAMWNTGGDTWGQLIKDVKSYAKDVSKHQRSEKSSKG